MKVTHVDEFKKQNGHQDIKWNWIQMPNTHHIERVVLFMSVGMDFYTTKKTNVF